MERRVIAAHRGSLLWRERTPTDAQLEFGSIEVAGAWVRRGASDSAGQRALRLALGSVAQTPPALPWTDPDVRDRVALLLARGALIAVRELEWTLAAPPAATIEAEAPQTAKVRSWLGIRLVDDEQPPRAVAFELFRVTLPDGSTYEGHLDKDGCARIDEIDPGTCKVTFPNLHAPDWGRS